MQTFPNALLKTEKLKLCEVCGVIQQQTFFAKHVSKQQTFRMPQFTRDSYATDTLSSTMACLGSIESHRRYNDTSSSTEL